MLTPDSANPQGGFDSDRRAVRSRVLLVASEIFPLAKTGGLADVCGALPKALRDCGVDVRLLMPAYPQAREALVGLNCAADVSALVGESPARLLFGRMPDSDLLVWLLDCPHLYQRPGTPYHDEKGCEWPDNARRYGALCRGAAALAFGRAEVHWRPDVVHCHDWHTGLVPLLLRLQGEPRPRTVFTVHNAAFQGNFPWSTAEMLGLPIEGPTASGMEFYGQVSFLKTGVVFADKVSTVSPTYASELLTPEYGCGMEGLFQSRAEDLSGIMNGIDTEVWNPTTDSFLAQRYSRYQPAGKDVCKAALQTRLGFRVDASAPIAISAGRLTAQKMADVLLERLPILMQRHPTMQFALLGCGDRTIERGFSQLAREFPARVGVEIGYQESSAHQLHAGADFLLHGSRFEPCGLTQLYAMRYGTVPIVRRVGGLADSVVDVQCATAQATTGFVFDQATGDALEDGVDRCVSLYSHDPDAWAALRNRAMATDFGWARSAHAYTDLYDDAIRGTVRNDVTDPAAEPLRMPNEQNLTQWRSRIVRLRNGIRAEAHAASVASQ